MAYGWALSSQVASHADAHRLTFAPDRAAPTPKVVVRLARSPTDHHAADLLLESLYASRGHLLSALDTDLASDLVLIAAETDETIGTLTLRFDGPGGLRADEVYGGELDAARAQGRRVCELGRFAVARGARSGAVIGALFHHAHRLVCDRGGITDVFVEVNPRHAAFYRDRFGFSVAAGERLCPRVRAPAVLLRLELAAFQARLRASGERLTDRLRRALPGALVPG